MVRRFVFQSTIVVICRYSPQQQYGSVCFLGGKPRLKIRRVNHLFEAKHSFEQAEREATAGKAFKPVVERVEVRRIKKERNKSNRGVIVELPVDVKQVLTKALDAESGSAKYLL